MWWCSQNNWDLKSLIPGDDVDDDDGGDVDLNYAECVNISSIFGCIHMYM